MTLLNLKNVTASYGSSQALFGVDLQVAEGEVMAVLGRNGVGKSTMVKAICRMLPSQGDLKFAGRDLGALSSHHAGRLGIGLVPEGRRCFADLTVTENLTAAARRGPWGLARVAELFPRLLERKNQHAHTLSGGEQQMLAIGRALMTNPRLLILDEATEGLAPVIKQEIWKAIAHLKAETGMALIVIDKSLSELRGISDGATILEHGQTQWAGRMSELSSDITERLIGV